MKKILLLSAVSLIGCSSNSPVTKPTHSNEIEVVTIQKEFAPQVWSDHKQLDMSESDCANKGKEILSSLGFNQIVKSKHGEYVYGNYINNRAAIKCLTVQGKTFMYAIVAGAKVEVVERLRNEIMWQY